MKTTYRQPTPKDLLLRAKEQAVIDIFGIAQRIKHAATERDGEDVLVEALRRWRDKDVF